LKSLLSVKANKTGKKLQILDRQESGVIDALEVLLDLEEQV